MMYVHIYDHGPDIWTDTQGQMHEIYTPGLTMFPKGSPEVAITLTEDGGFVIPDLGDMATKQSLSTTRDEIGAAAIVQGF